MGKSLQVAVCEAWRALSVNSDENEESWEKQCKQWDLTDYAHKNILIKKDA